jgi:hypothetical protein
MQQRVKRSKAAAGAFNWWQQQQQAVGLLIPFVEG